jgi:adenylate kinase family enzyme
MRNVMVVGICGAGKTTLARRLAYRLRSRHIEMDALRHGPDWSVRATLADDVERLTADPGWVADSDAYPEVADLLWSRADTVVCLDLPRRVVLARVARRTAWRLLARQRLWAGNRETLSGLLSRQHPLARVVLDFRTRRDRMRARSASFPGDVTHLRTVAEVRRWLATVAPGHDDNMTVNEVASCERR